jgi:ribosome-associated toxin RatA of RatAB toxin-antitoxin module
MSDEETSFPSVTPDFDISVEESEGQITVTAHLHHPADFCYQLFCDADLIPKWLWVVGTAVVQRRDEQQRALEVDFIGSLERASISYTLLYAYDDEKRKVTWHHAGSGVKVLAGSARFVPDGDERCTMRYSLESELAAHLPTWADDLYKKRPAETVVIDFCEWLEHYQQR